MPVESDRGQMPMKTRAAIRIRAGSFSPQAKSAGGWAAATRANDSEAGPKKTRAAARSP